MLKEVRYLWSSEWIVCGFRLRWGPFEYAPMFTIPQSPLGILAGNLPPASVDWETARRIGTSLMHLPDWAVMDGTQTVGGIYIIPQLRTTGQNCVANAMHKTNGDDVH